MPLSLCWRNTRKLGGRVVYLDYLLYLYRLIYLCILLSLRILTAFRLHRILRSHRKFQDLYLVTLQGGWMTVTPIIYERCIQSQVLYVIPVTSILGRLALRLVPVSDTCTIPFSMRKETCDFPGASCDSKKDACEGNQWWYINSTAMK